MQNDDRCGVLLMDQTGAVGLDLSFASWVFLLEPIEDVSVQQQVVSRAHRMGAKQPIHVEVLAMKVGGVSSSSATQSADDWLSNDIFQDGH